MGRLVVGGGSLTWIVIALGCASPGDGGSSDDGGSTQATAVTQATEPGSTDDGAEQGPPQSCPGLPEVGLPCRTADDCVEPEENLCGPVGSGGGCGGAGGCVLPWALGEPCARDEDCVDDGTGPQVCRRGIDPCCGEVQVCVTRCVTDGCGPDEVCADSGICTPVACDAGFACPAGWACEPAASGGDAHGCVAIPCGLEGALQCPAPDVCVDGTCERATCDRDQDCACGSCIESQCWARPWQCYGEPQ